MIVRTIRLGVAVACCIYDFKRNIQSLEGPERKASMPGFHQRTAERLFNMCCANRGTYIKVGQHVGAMEYLLPEQYITVFKELHSR